MRECEIEIVIGVANQGQVQMRRLYDADEMTEADAMKGWRIPVLLLRDGKQIPAMLVGELVITEGEGL